MATSLPDSFPNPDSFIPPNGDSVLDELPGHDRSQETSGSKVISKREKKEDEEDSYAPVFMPIMPASRFSKSLHILSMFFVKQYDARPICSCC